MDSSTFFKWFEQFEKETSQSEEVNLRIDIFKNYKNETYNHIFFVWINSPS